MTREGPHTPTESCFWPTGTWSTICIIPPPTRCSSACGRWGTDMWKVTLKGLLAHKLRLALTAIAIVLGVTFISGTFVLTDTLHNTFDTLFGHIYQSVDFEVRGTAAFTDNSGGGGAVRKPIPESIITAVRDVPGVSFAEGTVT